MSDTTLTSGGKHQLDRYFGFSTVSLSAAAESADVIAVTATLTDLYGNTITNADQWKAEVVGEAAAAYTIAETGAGAEVSITARPALVFTFSAAGVAELSVTDVSGGTDTDVVLLLTPTDTFGKPASITLTFDATDSSP